ncbi:MAG: membrane dipeptidase [Ammonifex sp.]|jgi:membrane dipeptidase|nr:MAG: membrane dipeptidase [Ammonifex sp.]
MGQKKDAEIIHKKAVVVDAHCDTLSLLAEGRVSFADAGEGHVDLRRLKQGGINVVFFAVFVHPRNRGAYLRKALEQVDAFHTTVAVHREDLVAVREYSGLRRALAAGKIAGILSVEGGHVLEGSLGVLRVLYQMYVRCLTLTWNGRNKLADGVGESESRGGLTSFGREVVREMERLGMLVDVAHLAPAGFWDVVRMAKNPVIDTHANSRVLCDHPRNLTDEQVRALAATGGVVGVNFVPAFVDPANPTIEAVADHIEHLATVGGIDCVGIGSDFDGTANTVAGLDDAACLPLLTACLVDRGWQEAHIRKVLGGNFLRVLKETWK